MSVNKVILIGRVGKDPKVAATKTGKSVVNFSLATDNRNKTTEWHNIVAWGNQADFVANYIKKGARLYVEGRISTRSYEDQAKQKKYITEIVAESIQALSDKQPEERQEEKPQSVFPEPAFPVFDATPPMTEDDVPF